MVIFDQISESIENILTEFPLGSFHICGLFFTTKTDEEGRYCRDFFIAYELTQITEEPFQDPDAIVQQTNLFNIFLTFSKKNTQQKFYLPFGLSDHFQVSVQIDAKPMTSSDLGIISGLLYCNFVNLFWSGRLACEPVCTLFKEGILELMLS